MIQEIQIGNKFIGEAQPLFIIAEIGVTCNYDIKITKELIDVVDYADADAVKLIFWFPEEIMADKSVTYTYQTHTGPQTENLYEMLNKLRFTLEEWREIKDYADRHDTIMFATVNSPSGIDYAQALGLEAIKVSSWDYNYLPLWRQLAVLGKPLFIDTGPATQSEIAKVMQIVHDTGNPPTVLLHCTHTDQNPEINLRSIPYLKNTFHTLVGFSSEGRRDELDLMAVALGAMVVEKRLTLSRSLPGHHHYISKEPDEFAEYVRMMRDLQSALGVYDIRPSPIDLQERKRWFRHLVANKDIPKGTRLVSEMLASKRPERGISPEFADFFIGKRTKRELRYNQALSWDDV